MADQNEGMIDVADQLLMFDENQNDPLLDNFVNNIGNHGTHFSGISYEENMCSENRNFIDFPRTSSFGNPIQVPVWPVLPSPYSCTCCQTLREFFYINGTNVLKLDVHGRLGLISHAVLERYDTDMSSENHEFQMFDFCQESISNVKQFLVQYCDDRKREGYIMLQDPLSNFYDALCIGLDGDGNLDADTFFHQTSRGDRQTNQEEGLHQPEEDENGVRLTKSYIASQRERTGRMRLRDLAGYFHLPINEASKELNICPSALKSICRKEGLLRWPHRKIKSIKNIISKKEQSLNSSDANERACALTEIQELQRRLTDFYEANVGMVIESQM